jgi:stearoyl-CoA desaturase (delta-9 desaturase)
MEQTNQISAIPEPEGLNWATTLVLILFHIAAIAALFCFSWKALAITVLLYWLTTGLGISMGYHRLHTHRSYKVPRLLEYFFAVCGALTLEGGPIFWVATHRIHHQKSDQAGRIRPGMAPGGRILAGYSSASLSTATHV